MIALDHLLKGITSSTPALSVSGISSDSRSVTSGDVFCAYPGVKHDGRDYIAEAIDRGAVCVLYEPARSGARIEKYRDGKVPLLPVADLRNKLGFIAARFYAEPSRDLYVIGVTGTNGKTSCAHLLAQSLEQLGVRCGVIGTLGCGFVDQLDYARHTTPDPVTIQRMLREFSDQGASHVAMEVSSHALDQGRVNGVAFDLALFTNLTHDHLDYHRDLAEYGATKAKLFTVPGLGAAVINTDDPFGARLFESTRARRKWSYGGRSADVMINELGATATGLQVDLQTADGPLELHTRLIGSINAPNLAAVSGALLAMGFTPDAIAEAVSKVRAVPGRMELFNGGVLLPQVVVDYAHTPDALERVLRSARDHCRGDLWCLFGCGGDRDRGKRPAMGAIARRWADHVVVTDDNPRSENPGAIATEIVAGMPARPIIIHDRTRAIDWSIHLALPQDWVVIAGKGHETTQQIGDRYRPHDDRLLVRNFLGLAA